MKILLVMDQFENANNGTTISAIRFAEGLKKRGHEVRILSTGTEGENKYVVKTLKLPIGVSNIIKSQGMCLSLIHI